MSAALELLRAAIQRLGARASPEARTEAARIVGEGFMRAAAENPAMYQRGNKFALGRAKLGEQFDTHPLEVVNHAKPDLGILAHYDYRIQPKDKVPTAREDGQSLLANVYYTPSQLLSHRSSRYLDEARDLGLIQGRRPIHVLDSAGLSANSGAGTKLYASAYGNIAAEPDAVNAVESLSGDNMFRRSLNMASAIGRDPGLGRKLLIAPSQLRDVPGLGMKGYHDLSPLEQLGILQLAAAQRTLKSVDTGISKLPGAFDASTEALYTKGMRERGQAAMSGALNRYMAENWDATPLSRGYSILPKTGVHTGLAPLGERTLRKARIVDDLLSGRPYEEIADKFTGLEFRAGGPVREP